MKDFKGTKGKWQMTTSALECDHNTEVATIWGDSEHGEGATLIAHIDKGAGNEKAISNAQLITAAPELLEACIIALSSIDIEDVKAYDIVNKAVNKALGKEAAE